MRLVIGNKLYNSPINEDFLDDINIKQDSASKQVVKIIDLSDHEFQHTVYFLFCMHRKVQFEAFVKYFQNIQNHFLYCIERERRIGEFELSVLIPDVTKVDIDTIPWRLIKNGKKDCISQIVCYDGNDSDKFFENLLYDVRQKFTKGNINIEFCLKFDIDGEVTTKKAARLTDSLFKMNTYVLEYINNVTKDDTSVRVIVDDLGCKTFPYRNGYKTSFIETCYKIFGSSSPEMKEYATQYLEGNKKKANDMVDIPDEIRKLITPKDMIYIAPSRVSIRIDDETKRISCHIPENVQVLINILLFIWYYCDKFIQARKKQQDIYNGIDIVVDGTILICNDLVDSSFHDWYQSITHAQKVYANGTDFKKLNSRFLQKVYVDELVLKDPILQTTKKDADVQQCQIFNTSWENPDVVITSPTHNIEIKPDEKDSWKMMLIATKK